MIIEFRIKEIREQTEMSLQEIEKETGINRHRLSDIENNKITDKVLFIEIVLIAKTLKVGIEEMFVARNVEIR